MASSNQGLGVNGKVRFASRKNKHVVARTVYEPGSSDRTWPAEFEQMRCNCKTLNNFLVRKISGSAAHPGWPYWACEGQYNTEANCGVFKFEKDMLHRYHTNNAMWRDEFKVPKGPTDGSDGNGGDSRGNGNGKRAADEASSAPPAKRQRTDSWKPPDRRPTGNAYYGPGGYAAQSVPPRKYPNLQVYCNCGPAQATYSRKRDEYFFTCMYGKDNEGACKFWLFESKLDDGRVDPKRDMIVDNLTLYTSPHTNNARENTDDGMAAEAAFARLCTDRGLTYKPATHFEHVIQYLSGTVGTGGTGPSGAGASTEANEANEANDGNTEASGNSRDTSPDRFGINDYTVDVYYNRLPPASENGAENGGESNGTCFQTEVLEAGPIWIQVYGIRLDARGALQDSKADRLVYFVRRGPGHAIECVHLDRRVLHAYVCDQVVDTDLVNSVSVYKNADMANVRGVGDITEADEAVQATSARMVFDPAAAYGALYSRFGSYDIQTLVTLDDLLAWDANVRPGLPLMADRPLVLDRWTVEEAGDLA